MRRRAREDALVRAEAAAVRPDDRDPTDRHAEHDRVLRALRELTDRERRVVVLRYYEDLSEAEIAAAVGSPPGTVKSTAVRALRKLAASPAPHLRACRDRSSGMTIDHGAVLAERVATLLRHRDPAGGYERVLDPAYAADGRVLWTADPGPEGVYADGLPAPAPRSR